MPDQQTTLNTRNFSTSSITPSKPTTSLSPPNNLPSPSFDPAQTIVNRKGGEFVIPDIPSEYFFRILLIFSDGSSDEEDNSRQKTENGPPIPHWAQTPNLNRLLDQQSNLNPSLIFGEIFPLKLEGIYLVLLIVA